MDERDALGGLLAILREYDLDALILRVEDSSYELVARPEPAAAAAPPAAPENATVPPPVVTSVAPPPPDVKKIVAPIIGVFYRSSTPGSEPFVEVGDRVEVGEVLCILEAMKLMNEITSDYAGVVNRILPENGALVSLGEEMFWIEP
jgi:acetyl-CoA carboxylase biotin carboxyl carrier protein